MPVPCLLESQVGLWDLSFSSNLKTLNAYLSLENKLMLFSTMAGTILVQARVRPKLNMDILNAIDERGYIDTWKLYE